MNRELLLSIGIMVGVGLVFLIGFLILRFLAEQLWCLLFRKKEELIAHRLVEHLAAIKPPQTIGERLDRFFETMVGRSDLGLSPTQAMSFLLLVAVALGAGLFLWRDRLELAILGAIGGVIVLLVFFWIMHWRWKRKIQDQLPDTIHLFARSLRAGLTVDQSVALIGTQGVQPLASEFKRCSDHLQLGMTVPAAFQMTADRIQLDDFNLLVSLIGMHRKTGGNLPLLVDRLATTVRSRNQFRGQVAAVTTLGRLSGFFIAAAAPSFMVLYWMLFPDYLARLVESPQGMNALIMACILEVVGVTWLLWLLRVDY